MKRLLRWGVLLYPARWRARYGDELLALVEDLQPRGGDIWDVLKGAVAMRLTTVTFLRITAAFALAGALAAGVWAVMQHDRYASTAVVRIAVPDGSEDTRAAAQTKLQHAVQFALSRTSLSQIILREKLYRGERQRLPLEDIIQQMRNRSIRIQAMDARDGKSGPLAAVSFVDEDPAAAQKTVGDLVAALDPDGKLLEVLDPASPAQPEGPGKLSMVARGLLAGLVAGVFFGGLWTLIRRARPWSVKRIGAFAAMGMVLGGTIAFLMPDEYISTAVGRAANSAALQGAIRSALEPAALAEVVRKYGLYPKERSRRSIEDVVREMRNQAIRVQSLRGRGLMPGEAFTISFRYSDGRTAQAVTGELLAAITRGYQGGGSAEVLDPASYPQAPSSPNRLQMIALGVVSGAVLGLAATQFRRPVAAAA